MQILRRTIFQSNTNITTTALCCLSGAWLKSRLRHLILTPPSSVNYAAFVFTVHLRCASACICICVSVIWQGSSARSECVHSQRPVWTEVCVWANSLFILLTALTCCTLQELNNKVIHTKTEWLHEVTGRVELYSPLGQLSHLVFLNVSTRPWNYQVIWRRF